MKLDANNKMIMIRGETERFTVAWPGEPFESGDSVNFTVSKTYADTPALHVQVTSFTQGVAVFDIEHADTANLDVGQYVYDIRVIRANGDYKTIVGGKKEAPAVFVLAPEVTK